MESLQYLMPVSQRHLVLDKVLSVPQSEYLWMLFTLHQGAVQDVIIVFHISAHKNLNHTQLKCYCSPLQQ